jgi:tetratricopeptide (TPR) repeat protein
VELGFTYFLEWVWKWSQDPQALERADELVRKAIALDDSLARAHRLLGFVYVQQHQYDQAAAESERAVALAPNNAESYAMQANVLLFAGRGADALRSIKQALRLNPRYPAVYLHALWGLSPDGALCRSYYHLQASPRTQPKLSVCLCESSFWLYCTMGFSTK